MANQIEFGGSVEPDPDTGYRDEYNTKPFIPQYGYDFTGDGSNEVFGGSESELPE